VHARVSYIDAESGDRIDGVIEQVESDVLPQLKDQDGFKGFTVLADRSSGRLIGISFWESEEALSGSEEVADQARQEAAETAGSPEPRVERYEVAIDVME
jgi:heme-degrading monooxygenase HmoA